MQLKPSLGKVVIDFYKELNFMKTSIIKLDLAGTTVHVNANKILYYYAKKTEAGEVVTELFFTEKFGIEVNETPAQIDSLIAASSLLS